MSGHLELEELIRLRDREEDQRDAEQRSLGELQEHVGGCERCRRELAGLEQVPVRLKALDDFAPPGGLWGEIEEQLAERGASRQRRRRIWSVALAAALLAACVVVPFVARELGRQVDERQLLAALTDQLVDVQERSALLELELRNLAAEPRILSGRQASAMITLEDALDQLDERLLVRDGGAESSSSGPPPSEAMQRDVELWQRRVELQLTLVELHVDPVTLYDL